MGIEAFHRFRAVRSAKKRRKPLTIRLSAFDSESGGPAPTINLSVNQPGAFERVVGYFRRRMSLGAIIFCFAATVAVIAISQANVLGWINDDNPIVIAALFLREGLIIDFGSWRGWAVIVAAPLLWRILPDGWRLVAFPFVAYLLLLQISSWAFLVLNGSLEFGFGRLFVDVLQRLQMGR